MNYKLFKKGSTYVTLVPCYKSLSSTLDTRLLCKPNVIFDISIRFYRRKQLLSCLNHYIYVHLLKLLIRYLIGFICR